MSRLLRDYFLERTDTQIIEVEEGFVTYKMSDGVVYIADMYVSNRYRGSKVAHRLADRVKEIGKELGCKEMGCSADVHAPHSDSSMKTILSYGFKPVSAEYGVISFKKEI